MSLLSHVLIYMMMVAAPLPVFRCPHVFSPSVYAGSIAWTMCIANPAMLKVAYSFDERPILDSRSAAMMLCAATAVCAVGAGCFLLSMKERFRGTFYKHHTFSAQMRDYYWNVKTVVSMNGELLKNCEREFVRADTMKSFARCYWPMDLVEPFVRENW